MRSNQSPHSLNGTSAGAAATTSASEPVHAGESASSTLTSTARACAKQLSGFDRCGAWCTARTSDARKEAGSRRSGGRRAASRGSSGFGGGGGRVAAPSSHMAVDGGEKARAAQEEDGAAEDAAAARLGMRRAGPHTEDGALADDATPSPPSRTARLDAGDAGGGACVAARSRCGGCSTSSESDADDAGSMRLFPETRTPAAKETGALATEGARPQRRGGAPCAAEAVPPSTSGAAAGVP